MDSLNSTTNGIHLPNNRYRNDTQVLKQLIIYTVNVNTRNKVTVLAKYYWIYFCLSTVSNEMRMIYLIEKSINWIKITNFYFNFINAIEWMLHYTMDGSEWVFSRLPTVTCRVGQIVESEKIAESHIILDFLGYFKKFLPWDYSSISKSDPS